jgi:hypothetical protein
MTRPLGPLCEASTGLVINTAAQSVSWTGTNPWWSVIVAFVAKMVLFINPICGLNFFLLLGTSHFFAFANLSSHLNQSMDSLGTSILSREPLRTESRKYNHWGKATGECNRLLTSISISDYQSQFYRDEYATI